MSIYGRMKRRPPAKQYASIGHSSLTGTQTTEILFMVAKMGAATMARPNAKPFDSKNVKSESEYAKEAMKDAQTAVQSGKGQVNRDENLGDTAGAARHTITGAVPNPKD